MPNDIAFGANDKPAAAMSEADQLRPLVTGDMGADPDAARREIAGTTADLERVSDPASRQMLQEHLDDMKGQLARLGDEPGRSSTIKWGDADRPAAQRDLPAGVAPSNAGAGRGVVQPPTAVAPQPSMPPAPSPVTADAPAPLGDPMGSGAAEIAEAPNNAPQAGAGRGSVNPPLVGDDTREDVGALKSFGLGWGKAGASSAKVINLAAAAPIVLAEKLKNAITGSTDTSAQDAVFRNLVDPMNEAVNWYSLDANQKQGFLSKVAEGLGGLTQDLPLMIASGGQAAEAKLAQAFPTMMQFVGKSVGQGFTAMRPLMIKSGVEKAQQVLDSGGTVDQAMTSAATAAMLTGFTGGQPMSAEGPALARVLTGIPVGAATNEGRRVIQNAADPANVQEPFSPEGAALGAVTNSAIAGSMWHPGHVDASVTQSRIDQLRAAGEKDVADLVDKQLTNTKVAGELGSLGHVAQDPAFQAAYREHRLQGAKPAEAAARAGMTSSFDALSTAADVPAAAISAARAKAADMPLDQVPTFFEKFLATITSQGLGRPLPAGSVDANVGAARDQALNAAVERIYSNPASKLDAIKQAAEGKPAEQAANAEPDGRIEPTLDTGNDVALTPEAETAHQAATSPLNDLPEPTQAQKDAGNYKVGRLNVAGLDISVENPQGSTRRGKAPDGTPWQTPMQDHYGYIRGTVGADKDHLDVFVKPGTPADYKGPVFVIDQVDPKTGAFDEHKVVIGAPDEAAARAQYLRNYQEGWKGLGAITELPMPAFKAWAKSDHTKEPLGEIAKAQAEPEAAAPVPAPAADSAVPEVQPERSGAVVDAGTAEQPDQTLSAAPSEARAKAAKRLGLPSTSPKGEPTPAHAFIAAEGGMSRATMSDMGFDRNVRVGNRTLFAGQGKGMTLEQATELLKEHGYLPEGSGHTETANLIAKSMKTPQYTAEGWARVAEAEAHTRFEDHLASQQDAGEDPFKLTPEEAAEIGFDKASEAERDEFYALVQAAEAEGIDTGAILENAHDLTHNASTDEFRNQAVTDIAAARAKREAAAAEARPEQGRKAAEPEGAGNGRAAPGAQGAARSQPEALSWEQRPSGNLAVKGDPESTRKVLADNGITRVMLGKDGVLVGKTEAAAAEKLLTKLRGKVDKLPAEPAGAKPLAVGMAPGNAEPVTVKDGIVHIGKDEAINFDTGEPVKVAAGASDAQIKQALRDAGALSKRQRFFGGNAEPTGDTLTSPTKEDVLAQQRRAEEGNAAEAKAKKDEEQRAAADAQRDEFGLTGSDRPADANPKQKGMFAREDDATRRSRPRSTIAFKDPITGPTGAKLAAYTWQWKPVEFVDKRGEDRVAHVSDWEKSATNAETGREVVHQFVVEDSNGDRHTVSAESALRMLGFAGDAAGPARATVSAVKTLARLKMQMAETEAAQAKYDSDAAEVAARDLPPITGPDDKGWYHMGDTSVRQIETGALRDERRRALTEHWRSDQLAEMGWKGGTFAGDSLNRSISELRDRIARAEKKIGPTTEGADAGSIGASLARSNLTDTERAAAMRALDRRHTGMDVATAEKAAKRLTAGWKDGPEPKVVLKPSELPGNAPADARGFYDGKTIWIVASRHNTEHELAITIAHEAVAHHSLREMLGDDFSKLAKNIRLAIASGNKPLAEIRDYVRRTYVDENGKFNLSHEEEADEIAARAVELAVDKNGEFKPAFGFFKSVYSKIAEFLRGIGLKVAFTHAELQGMLVRAHERLSEARAEREGTDQLAAAARDPSAEKTRKALSQVDEMFALPKSEKTDVAGIAADNDPGIKVKQLADVMGRQAWKLTMPDGNEATITMRPHSPFPQVYDMKLEEGDAKSISTERQGKGGDTVHKDDVWTDVSNLKPGGFGAMVYNIAATFAHNTGRVFIGDPHGLTDEALRRRTEHMLSSALKFGTTEHLAPHRRQIEGSKELGVPPLDWTYGDHEGNIRSLLRTSLESNRDANPLTFERSTGRFVDSEGRELDDDALRQIAEEGPHRAIGAGVKTLKRNAVLDSLVREESGAGSSGGGRNGVLENLLELAGQSPASTRGLFYARGDGLSADEADQPERAPYTGPGAHLIESARTALGKIIDDAFMSTAPMSAGSDAARAIAKDFANADRLARWKWTQFDDVLKKNFTEAQRKKMWEAADEENVLRQTGADRTGKGLERLDPKEREVMDSLHDYGEQLLQRAKDVGMFKGEGLPYWTPRMAVMIGANGEFAKIPGEGKQAASGGVGRNVTVTASSLKQRKYLTAEETEAAANALAKERGGQGAQLVRDVRTMPMAMARLERAIAGRELIDQIKELGTNLGVDTTSTTRGPNFFTLDHPAFQTYRYRPDVKYSEAMDKHLWQGLLDFADKIGVSPERTADMRGNKWGYASRAGEVVTRFGGPETVLTHELGHQLDFKYGLADMLTKKGVTAKELRALADLRFEGEDAPAAYRKYVRQGSEKIANMVHAYVHAKDRFAEVAPNTLKAFEGFLEQHPELADLKKIRASLVLDSEHFSKRPPGEDFDVLPMYVSKDFEGPLKAVLTEPTGEFYKAMMALKGKTMGLIMYSPLIHNAVEWGRALPMMPGKVVTFSIYFSGNRIKNDPMQMAQAVRDGMVPIGHRGNMQDITGLMEDPSLAPGRSWTAKLLGGAVGAVNDKAGTAVKKGVDAAGDFWHNTLLWDRVGDLQAGLYGAIRDDLAKKGMGAQTAGRLAAHFANRYAGALPNEAMSASARKIANFVLFSRSFTLGNLGVMKDMLTGFPPDVAAQIKRDASELELKTAKSVARRKAAAAFALDIALLYAGNSLLQSALDHLKRDKSLDEILHGYAERFDALMKRTKENPLDVLSSPLESVASLTPNSGNEPGKEDRIHYGTDDKGTNVYMRLPTGKIGEEFKNWLQSPLQTLLRKQGTIMRPITQTIENDKGFGQRVYNPDDKTWAGMAKNVGRIVWNFMSQQVPADSIQAGADWAQGRADETDKLKVLGPLAGLTFSHGAPGGPEVGEMYHENKVYQGKVADIMPDVRHALKVGKEDEAIKLMQGVGMPDKQIDSIIRKNEDPQSRLNSKALKDYYKHASEESKARMDNYGR